MHICYTPLQSKKVKKKTKYFDGAVVGLNFDPIEFRPLGS